MAEVVLDKVTKVFGNKVIAGDEASITIADKEFPKQAAFKRWIEDSALDERTKKELLKRVKKTRRDSKDYLVCLDATTGGVKWKTEVPSKGGQRWNLSGTPALPSGVMHKSSVSESNSIRSPSMASG